MAMQKATIGAIVVLVYVGVIVSALGTLVATQTVTNTGSITAVGVGVYSNSGCTTVLSTIPWGTLNPGSTSTYTIYVKDTGDTAVTLSMVTSGWNPSTASNYITLTWNQNGTTLQASNSVAALLTLSVSSSISSSITSFSFNITITGTH